MRKIVLTHASAPGDIVTMTGLVRDIALTYPGQYAIDPQTRYRDVWENNPYVSPLLQEGSPGQEAYRLCYGRGLKDQKVETVHFLSYWHRNFEVQTGIKVPVVHPKPDLHLSAKERSTRLISGRYWVLMAGGKLDFPIKIWSRASWQKLADMLGEAGIPMVQAGAQGTNPSHAHYQLSGPLNLVGQTSLRELFQLIYHADGVICGITLGMHVAAALERPCVVVAGGREAWWWEAYVRENSGLGVNHQSLVVPHRYLHTIGLLDCCQHHGCWKDHVIQQPGMNPKKLCKRPIALGAETVAECLHMITPEMVKEAVMTYYDDKTLAPIVPSSTAPQLLSPTTPTMVTKATVELRGLETPANRWDILDHPLLGGKFTVFVLLYGKYPDMHRRCLRELLATVPIKRMELRVGSNELCPESAALVDELVQNGQIALHYAHPDNRFKYPVMREMFHDPNNPILTPYTIWMDDDTFVGKTSNWMPLLAETIVENHSSGFRQYGPLYSWKLSARQQAGIQAATWYRGRYFQTTYGNEAPNGDKAWFSTGSFWAIETALIKVAEIPDVRLGHNGGDILIGEQIHQAGFRTKAFSNGKSIVEWSGVPRRGYAEREMVTL